jgi:ubiquinone/menaquinone biosynthesis C-methylase UbiE
MGAEHKEVVKAQFGAQAAEYAKGCFVGDETLNLMLKYIEPNPEDEALDVATGAGFTAAALASNVKEVVASDITEEMLETAASLFKEKGLTNVLADVADAEALPYADEVFDIVTCRIAAHHFVSVRRAVMEMARVMKEGGRLGIADSIAPADPDVDEFVNALEKLRDPGHVRNYSEAEWRALLTDGGFDIVEAETGVFDIGFEEWVDRSGASDRTKRHLRKQLLGAGPKVKEAIHLREEEDGLHFDNFWMVVGARKRSKNRVETQDQGVRASAT